MDKNNECGCGSCSICYDFEMKPLLEAREAIQRVRELHKQVEYRGQVYCFMCGWYDIHKSLAYPCPTIQALDGEQ